MYRLIRAKKLPSGVIKHQAIFEEQERDFRYLSIRIAMIWPGESNPAFFVVGGMEIDDEMSPSEKGVIRILQEQEVNDLSLNILFDAVTSAYTSMLADAIYIDGSKEDFKKRFWDYLDSTNLRMAKVWDLAYKDPILRLSNIKDFNDAGDLLIDRGSLLFQDLQGISRSHLRDDFEAKFYRLNALGSLVSGFQKSPPRRPLQIGKWERKYGPSGWMVH